MAVIDFILIGVAFLGGILLGWFLRKPVRENPAENTLYLKSEEDLQRLRAELQDVRQAFTATLGEAERLKQRNSDLEERLLQREEDVKSVREEMQKDFQILADRLFSEKSETFRKTNEAGIKNLLEPLDKELRDFRKTVNETSEKNVRESTSIKEQIEQLRRLNQSMTEDAKSLTTALKGDSKSQGNWGEIVLERILESSGLEEGREYELQYGTTNQSGKRIQPDVIVKLPDNKHLIIDSKVSLTAYHEFVSGTDEETRRKALKSHVESLKSHVKGLSEKDYPSATGLNAPDFVLMFIPVESSFGAAVQADDQLFEYAWKSHIVLVSPSTLLATMRTIAGIWKQEYQSRNALAIATEASSLVDKFILLVEELAKLGNRLEGTQQSYAEVMKKLSEGKGNLISRFEKLKKMGAKATKNLPSKEDKLWRNAVKEDKNQDEPEEPDSDE
jgi:DNA recombination protein RmuC